MNDKPGQTEVARQSFEHMRFQVSELEKRSGFLVTATAFFLTATAALLNNSDVRNSIYIFSGNDHVHLVLILLVSSLILGTFSVIHAVLAIGPQVRHYQHVNLTKVSFLSFLSIAERPIRDWASVATEEDDDVRERYQRDMYIREAAEMAKEAQYRYGRLGEVRAFLFLAVASLGMALVLVLDSLSRTGSRLTGDTRSWDLWTTIGVGVILTALTYVAARDRVRIEDDGWAEQCGKGSTVWVLRQNARWYPLLAGFTAASVDGSLVAFCCALTVMVPIIHTLWFRRKVAGITHRVLDRVSGMLAFASIVPVIIFYSLTPLRIWLLPISLMPLIVFEGIRLVDLLGIVLAISKAGSRALDATRSKTSLMIKRFERR